MGGAESTATSNSTAIAKSVYNSKTVNKSDLNLLNKSVNNFTANSVISDAKSCSANISQVQNVSFENIVTGGNFEIGEIEQGQNAALTFSCVTKTQIQNTSSQGVMSEYMNAIKGSFSTDALTDLSTKAASAASAGASATQSGVSIGSAAANSNSNSYTNTDSTTNISIENQITQNIQNVVENAVTNNFSAETVQNCISMVDNNQNVSFKNLDIGGSVKIKAIKQDQAATSLSDCMMSSSNANDTTTAVATKLGLVTVAEGATKTVTTVKTTGEATAAAESTSTSKGLSLPDFGGMSIASSVASVVLLILIAAVGYFMSGGDPAVAREMAGSFRKGKGKGKGRGRGRGKRGGGFDFTSESGSGYYNY